MNTKKRKNLTITIWVSAILLIGYFLANRPSIDQTQKQTPKKLLEYTKLTNSDGTEVTSKDVRGKWTLLFFGYLTCPDVCPTSLAYIAKEYKAMSGAPKNINVVFVSVDPKRDKPEAIGKYVRFFDESFMGWTGSTKELNKIVSQAGAEYRYEKSESALSYLVVHSSKFYLFDPNGKLFESFRPHQKTGELAISLTKIISRKEI